MSSRFRATRSRGRAPSTRDRNPARMVRCRPEITSRWVVPVRWKSSVACWDRSLSVPRSMVWSRAASSPGRCWENPRAACRRSRAKNWLKLVWAPAVEESSSKSER